MESAQKLAIMIVDDRTENLVSMKQLLARDDLDIITAESGNEALGKMLETDLALVLLDVQMPGMDGFEVAELMRRNERTRRIPVIFVTAINKERRHIFSGFEVGAVDYIFKPVDPFIIRSKVQVFLDIKKNERARESLLKELNSANKRLQEISDLKSDYLSAASHELRTPLTVIKEYCSLVHDEIVGPCNEEQHKCMEAALRNCNRLADLVNDLLDLDSIESGHMSLKRSAVDLNGLLSETVADFSSRCQSVSQHITLDLPETLPPALGDKDLITQVMVNLVGNAHKFTPGGGTISVRGTAAGNELLVEIKDTGPGIEPEVQKKVFDKFTQLNRTEGPGAKGTGLGLAISSKLVEIQGGKLDLESAPGQGSNFFFTLPVFNTAAHLEAFVVDGSAGAVGSQMDWTLLLLKPGSAQKEVPSWLLEGVEKVMRRHDDSTTRVDVQGVPSVAVLLQADQFGAQSFLLRLGKFLTEKGHSTETLGFTTVAVGRDYRSEYTWETDHLEFEEMFETQDSKGMKYV